MSKMLVWAVVCSATFSAAVLGQTPPPVSPGGVPGAVTPPLPTAQGLRVFTVGHSFHAWVGPLLLEMARAAGFENAESRVMRLGASTVENCWEYPEIKNWRNPQPGTNTAKDALITGTVDVLTLSPIWMPDEGIDHFAELALQHNPQVRVTVQEFWLPNDTYEPVYPLQVRKSPTVDHDAATMPELRKAYEAYFYDVDTYVQSVNKKLGGPVVEIVPVGQATLALREKIVAGQVPGIEKQSELFRDPWGHPTSPLAVLSGYCHYAVIYRHNPVGLPMPKELKGKYRNAQLNQILQALAWDAVVHHPLNGAVPRAAPPPR